MSSRAAAAMYPDLARAEDKQQRESSRVVQEGKPAWGKSNNPVWQSNRVEPAKPGSRVRPVEMSVENLSRVPGLVRRK